MPYVSVSGMGQSVTLLAGEICTAIKNSFGVPFERRLKSWQRTRVRCGSVQAADLLLCPAPGDCTNKNWLCRTIVGRDSKATTVASHAALKATKKKVPAVPAEDLSRLWPRERQDREGQHVALLPDGVLDQLQLERRRISAPSGSWSRTPSVSMGTCCPSQTSAQPTTGGSTAAGPGSSWTTLRPSCARPAAV